MGRGEVLSLVPTPIPIAKKVICACKETAAKKPVAYAGLLATISTQLSWHSGPFLAAVEIAGLKRGANYGVRIGGGNATGGVYE